MIPPTVDEVRALHEKYAPTREALDLVYTHCEIVCHIAEQLMARAGLRLDASLVRAGALLHDIGVYRLYSPDGAGSTRPTTSATESSATRSSARKAFRSPCRFCFVAATRASALPGTTSGHRSWISRRPITRPTPPRSDW
ncbi:hypothetical protein SANTM175S_04039 [Streptomyces antimycoticus]